MRVKFKSDNPLPTADQVAVGIVTASRELGCDPILVASGVRGIGANTERAAMFAVSRARAYAALALRAVFECNQTAIARMVGAGTATQYMKAIDKGIKDKTNRWWDDAIFMRVVHALDRVA